VNATQPSGQNATYLCLSINGSAVNGLVPTVDAIIVQDVDNSDYVQSVEQLIAAFSPPDASLFYNRCGAYHRLACLQ
jgi:hypothetical protein